MTDTDQQVGAVLPLPATDNTHKTRTVNSVRIKSWICDTLAVDAEITHLAANDAELQALLRAACNDDEQTIRFLSLLTQVFDSRSRAEIALDE